MEVLSPVPRACFPFSPSVFGGVNVRSKLVLLSARPRHLPPQDRCRQGTMTVCNFCWFANGDHRSHTSQRRRQLGSMKGDSALNSLNKNWSEHNYTVFQKFGLQSTGIGPLTSSGAEISNANTRDETHHAWIQKGTIIQDQRVETQPEAQQVDVDGALRLAYVPHLSDWLGQDLEAMPSPLKEPFVEEDEVVLHNITMKGKTPTGEQLCFKLAGPRDKVYFAPDEVRACIVTSGGLCPGLNTVIREIVCGLWSQYGVLNVVGIKGGYTGFYDGNTIALDHHVVNDIHKRGGTILGTSRNGYDIMKICNNIQDREINQVYIVGNDEVQITAYQIHEELQRRKLKVVVAGILRRIDNDLPIVDMSFGFATVIEQAQRAIHAAYVEAESARGGAVVIVKVAGRESGFIATYASLASGDVDLCLIPEICFYLEGHGGLYNFVQKRMKEKGHVVIVVAEGAGQALIQAERDIDVHNHDIFGNSNNDIGVWLSNKLKKHLKDNESKSLCIRYIDPSYIIRVNPSNASDNVLCTLLADGAIHGAMAGFSGFAAGVVNGKEAYIPMQMLAQGRKRVNVNDKIWVNLLSSTNQPRFELSSELGLTSRAAATSNRKPAEG